MQWNEIPAGKLERAQRSFWTALGDKADFVVRSINNDEGYLAHLAAYAVSPPFADKMLTSINTQWLRARKIMGRNFFGLEEVSQHFGLACSRTVGPEGWGKFAEVPFSEEVLASCKDTHVLVAVFPLSILDIRTHIKGELTRLFDDQSWYDEDAFANDRGEVGWHLVRKTPVKNSTNKTWDEQQALLGKDDETPKAHVMVYTMIGHFMATNERLFEKVWVRCSDLVSGGGRVSVGNFDARGLCVSYDWDGSRSDVLGLASARK